MIRAEGSTTYVAVSPHVIGMALVELHRGDQPHAVCEARWLHIAMLFVHPSAQRKGVGSALLRRVFEVAEARDHTGARVWTGTDNPEAQQFYSSVGMVPTGRRTPGAFSEQAEYELVLGKA
jgi:GNAT superfamily N-acetyltransferase